MKLPWFIYQCSAMLRPGSVRDPTSPHGRTTQGPEQADISDVIR